MQKKKRLYWLEVNDDCSVAIVAYSIKEARDIAWKLDYGEWDNWLHMCSFLKAVKNRDCNLEILDVGVVGEEGLACGVYKSYAGMSFTCGRCKREIKNGTGYNDKNNDEVICRSCNFTS